MGGCAWAPTLQASPDFSSFLGLTLQNDSCPRLLDYTLSKKQEVMVPK